jgi:hypothetical protein
MEQFQNSLYLIFLKKFIGLFRIVSSPLLVYDTTKPTKGFDKEVLKFLFYDGMLEKYIPHAKYGETVYNLSNIISHIVFAISGRFWPQSNYAFVDEQEFKRLMRSVGFPIKSIKISQKELFNNVLNNYLGHDLVEIKDGKNIIDTNYLNYFECRPGYSKLGGVIHLDQNLCFDYVLIDGKKRSDEFAIRRCLTAIFTIITIEHHFINTHTLLSDNLNVLLHQIDNTSAIFRILKPFMHDSFRAGERGSIVLLGETGLFSSFNFTRKAFGKYYSYAEKKFDFGKFLTPINLPGYINQHKYKWFNCIKVFVTEFLNENNNGINLQEGVKFLNLIETAYPKITYPDGTGENKLDKIIAICTMILYINIKHECFSNAKFTELITNPFVISFTWKNGTKETPLNKRISNLGEQTTLFLIGLETSLDGLMLIDKRWIEMCCVTPQEKQIYCDFFQSVENLGIPKDSVLHPSNIGCSVAK